MKIKEILKEMPEIIPPQFQNMTNKGENGRIANNVKKYKISKQFLWNQHVINVAEINNNIYYYILSEDENNLLFLQKINQYTKDAVTVEFLWKSENLNNFSTSDFILDNIISKFTYYVSDNQQTVDGKKMWTSLMKKSVNLGYEVGFSDGNNDEIFNNNQSLEDWLTEHNIWNINYRLYIKRE